MGRAQDIGSSQSRATTNRTQQSGGSGGPFLRAVVIDLISDPSYLTDDELTALFSEISNPGILSGNASVPAFDPEVDDVAKLRVLIPRNTLKVQIVTDGAGKGTLTPSLCFPFFSPHIQFPVKPGEQIWVYNDNPGSPYFYWMSRIVGPGFVDDINYTHLDRQILPGAEGVEPAFPNGDGTQANRTIGIDDTYETIVAESASGLSFTPETVPRFTRRPGDLALQGSNNTLILMSDDRGWGADESPGDSETSNASKTDEERERVLAGSIDVVAGRGRFLADPGSDPSNTSPKSVDNARGETETDKFFLNPTEGDPDFVRDSSRVYVSMNTDGDAKLGLEEGDTLPTAFEGEYPQSENEPFVIMKSDNVRIVARKDDDNGINGSIRIVKEGSANEDLATIMITPEGNIQISGAKIFIGRAGNDGGSGAVDGAEPYMRFSDFEAYMNDTLDKIAGDIEDLAGIVETATGGVGGAANVTPGYGGPNPALATANGQIAGYSASGTKGQKDQMDDIKSERIFGE
jgi:hypothetical protein